jgi:hypothetical protein
MPSRFCAVSARICVRPPPLRAAGRHRVRPPGALQEHEALEQVGIDLRLARGALDQRAVARRAHRSAQHAAGRVGVEGVARAARGAAYEVLGALGVPRERVRDRLELPVGRRRGDELDPGARLVVSPEYEHDRDDHERQAREHGESAHHHHPSSNTLPRVHRVLAATGLFLALRRHRPMRRSRCASSASTASTRPARPRG